MRVSSWRGRRGQAGQVTVRLGEAGKAILGMFGFGWAWSGTARQAWFGLVQRVKVGQGMRGVIWFGAARSGMV